MTARKPSAAQRAVLLAFLADLNPFDAENMTRNQVAEAWGECEQEGWIDHETWTLTDAGREAIRRARPEK